MRSEHLASCDRAFHLRFEWPACPRCGEPSMSEPPLLFGKKPVRRSWSCDACGYSFPAPEKASSSLQSE